MKTEKIVQDLLKSSGVEFRFMRQIEDYILDKATEEDLKVIENMIEIKRKRSGKQSSSNELSILRKELKELKKKFGPDNYGKYSQSEFKEAVWKMDDLAQKILNLTKKWEGVPRN